MAKDNGDEREEISSKVVELLNTGVGYEDGSKRRIDLYKSIVDLIIADRKDQRKPLLRIIDDLVSVRGEDECCYDESGDCVTHADRVPFSLWNRNDCPLARARAALQDRNT